MRYIFLFLLVTLILSCNNYSYKKISKNNLLTINNLENFFYKNHINDINYLVQNNCLKNQKVKSIAIYMYSTANNNYFLFDSIILNKKGKPILFVNEFFRIYFFYDKKGNGYLDIAVSNNYYDTIYTLRRFDKFNRIQYELRYNKKRKEYIDLKITNILFKTDSFLKIIYEEYSLYNYNNILLPFETRDIEIKLLNDSIVKTFTKRVVHSDTGYNSEYIELYKIKDNFLIPVDNKSKVFKNINSDCFEFVDNKCYYKRKFYFYENKDEEFRINFPVDQLLVKNLYSKMDSLRLLAWEEFKRNIKEYNERLEILENEKYIDSIILKESNNIEDFTPKLWHIVCKDSGYINGLNLYCLVVGYNTPLKDSYDDNKRCLAIFEKRNDKYFLIKQSFNTLESFIDIDDDLLFNYWDETNYSIEIVDGNIVVEYYYMRGGSKYIFSYENNNWVLIYFSSYHLTCCKAESWSYDYRTKEYHYSSSSTNDVKSEEDTIINIIQERPIIYMDSLNVTNYYFNETGILVK